MPAHHHRAVDRVASILEHVARERGGLTLTDLANSIGAPKSSLQGLVYGLVATGYLSEQDKRYYLGAAPFVLTLMNNPVAARGIRHEWLVQIQQRVDTNIVLAVRVGDTYVALDRVANNDAQVEFKSRAYRRGPLLSSAMGKTILANLPEDELQAYLVTADRKEPEAVRRFLAEIDDIKATGLAYNRGGTLPGVFAVAAPFHDSDGRFVAAIGATGDAAIEARLVEVGQRLLREVRRLEETVRTSAAV